MKKLLSLFVLPLLCTITAFSQSQEHVFKQWDASTGTQNFFYKNITKSDATYNYTAGATLNSNGDYDLLLVKYNKSGVVQWTKQYDGTGHGADMATGLHIDASGNVYVTGTTYVNGTNFNDIITIKYNSAGTQQWLSTYNGSGSSYDAGGAIIVNTAGTSVYICGGAMSTSNLSDFVTISYNGSTGAQNWVSTYNYNGNYDIASKMSLTGLGQVTLVVSGGVQYNSSTWRYATINYATLNGSVWGSVTVSQSGTGTLDELGDICEDASQTYTYVVGSINNTGTGTGYDYKIAKLDNSDLTVVWQTIWNGSDNLDDKAADVAVDGSGNVYVTGYTTTTGQDKNYATVKYNSSGTLQWTKYYNGSANGRDEATAINIDNSNNVYVTGTSNTGSSQDYYTIKYNSNNTVIWETSYNGQYNGLDKAYDIAIDNNTKAVIISGQTQTPTGYSYTTVQYSQATIVTNPSEVFRNSYSFTENVGQLLKTNGTSATNIKYYNQTATPAVYFSDTAISYVIYHVDTLTVTNDTIHRVDLKYVNSVEGNSKHYAMNKRYNFNNYFLAHIPEGRAHVTNFNRLVTPELYNKIDAFYTVNQNGTDISFVCKPGSSPAANIKLRFSGADSIRIVSNELIIYTRIGQIKYRQAAAYEIDNSGNVYMLGWQPTYVRNSNDITFTLGTYNTSRNLTIVMSRSVADIQHINTPEWSTLFGGNGIDEGMDLAVDDDGNLYNCGYTFSTDFPTQNGFFPDHFGIDADAYIAKFGSANGVTYGPAEHADQLLWATYWGGGDYEVAKAIASFGNGTTGKVYITGQTQSSNFPTYHDGGTYEQTSLEGSADAFIIGLNVSDGASGKWASHFGGDGTEVANAITTDASGNIYIGGTTSTATYTSNTCIVPTDHKFPKCNTSSSYNNGNSYGGGNDGFIARFSTGGQLQWSSFYGGTGRDAINDLAFDNNGLLYITGETTGGIGFPITSYGNYNQSTYGGGNIDAFIGRFTSSLSHQWCSYFGGNGVDISNAISIDANNNVYIGGETASSTPACTATCMCTVPTTGQFPLCKPTSSYFQGTGSLGVYGGGDADGFIAKFNSSLSFTWGTYYGGASDERINDLDVDYLNQLYFTGQTISTSPVTNFYECCPNVWDWFQDHNGGGYDPFLGYFNVDNGRVWASYYGSNSSDASNDETGNAIAVYATNPDNHFWYTTGGTKSNNFYTFASRSNEYIYCCQNAYLQNWPQGQTNPGYAYLTRFSLNSHFMSVEDNGVAEFPVQVFPNPTSYSLTMSMDLEQPENILYEVYTMAGQLTETKNLGKQVGTFTYTIDFSGLAAGTYFLQIKTERNSVSKKIIKYE